MTTREPASSYLKDTYVSGEQIDSPDTSATNVDDYYPFDAKKKQEHERLDEQHHALLSMMHGKLVHAPLINPKRILDVGCGTGITTIYFATQYPDAEVIGLDPSPVPPTHGKPKNVKYVEGKVQDFTLEGRDGELGGKGSFDYIYSRYMILSVSDWPAYLTAMTTFLRPGGWLEMHEGATLELYSAKSPISTLNSQPNYPWTWTEVVHCESSKHGLDIRVGKALHSHFLNAGLNNVTSTHYPLVLYPWTARPETVAAGIYHQKYSTSMLSVLLGMFTKHCPEEQRTEWLRQIENTYGPSNRIEGLHWRFYAVVGRAGNLSRDP